MAAFVFYLVIIGVAVYLITRRDRLFSPDARETSFVKIRNGKTGSAKNAAEIWKQVYETASMDEAVQIRAQLSAEGIECILYEQGKKDVHGNFLKGVGVAVPGTAATRAQGSIAKMPV